MGANRSIGHGSRYSAGAIALHWSTAAAFAFQIGLGWRMDAARGPQTFAVFQLHKSIGITILLLTLARVAWRLLTPPPPLPATMPVAERRLAHGVHLLFYALLLGLPLSGWLIVSSSKVLVPTRLYGTIPWPHLPGIAGLSPGLRGNLNQAAATGHAAMGWIALAAIALHVLGALKHQYFERGDYLARMTALPRRTLGAAAILIVAAFLGLMAFGRRVPLKPIALATPAPPAPPVAQVAPVAPSAEPAPAAAAAAPPPEAAPIAKSQMWTVRMKSSTIRFHTAWSQGPVDGSFGTWRASIRFDPAALEKAAATITIDMASATAADADQQSALPGADWFAAATHPTAIWRATAFHALGGDRYRADGTLTLRGVSRPLALPFTLTIAGDVATMAATASIDRTVFGVGQGEWASTADLPAAVSVSVALKADRAPVSTVKDQRP